MTVLMVSPNQLREIAQGPLPSVGGSYVWKIYEMTGPSSLARVSVSPSDLGLSNIAFFYCEPAGLPGMSGCEPSYIWTSIGVLASFDITLGGFEWDMMFHSHRENLAGAYTQNVASGNVDITNVPAPTILQPGPIGKDTSADVVRFVVIGVL